MSGRKGGELGVEERELVVDEKVLEVEERGNQCFFTLEFCTRCQSFAHKMSEFPLLKGTV